MPLSYDICPRCGGRGSGEGWGGGPTVTSITSRCNDCGRLWRWTETRELGKSVVTFDDGAGNPIAGLPHKGEAP